MRALAICLAVLVYTAGCGGSSSPTDAGIGLDSATATDLASSPDLAHFGMAVGIACGTTPCAANAQFCCTSTAGATGMCGFGNDAASCGGSRFYCDGPEDCPPASPYCCISDGVAECRDNQCPGNENDGEGLCHSDADCAASKVCCGKATTPYLLCLDACP